MSIKAVHINGAFKGVSCRFLPQFPVVNNNIIVVINTRNPVLGANTLNPIEL
jgi:hypothetical protein